MRTCAAILLAFACAAEGQRAADRLAVSVDRNAIFESEILDQIRVVAFLEDREPDYSRESRRAAAERLIELTLIRREMEISRFTPPSPQEALPLLAAFRKTQYADDAKYRQALAARDLREEDLLENLLAQLTLTRFIAFRFRPGIQVLEAESRDYYQKEYLPVWRKARPAEEAPPFEDVVTDIETVLAERKVDQALDDWLKTARATSRIIYRSEVFE